ncbi:MAG: LysE family transporter [Rhodospirillales bacterium]|nr:LysE family transporter [Rhodospirillales bacterium]
MAAVGGVQLGLIAHTLLAAAGISALISASPVLLRGLAIAGAIYLGWLGLKELLANGGLRLAAATAVPARVALRQALLTNLLNPKVLLLFFALYPNFIVAGRAPLALQIGILSAVLIVINTIWQVGLAWFADRARIWMDRPRLMRKVDGVLGIILIGFAAILIVEHVR